MRSFWTSLAIACALVVADAAALAETPETVAIIGTGRVGSALGPRFARIGHPVIYGSRDPSQDKVRQLVANTRGARAMKAREAADQAQIIVLAMPWSAVQA